MSAARAPLADSPDDLPRRSWWLTAKRAFAEFRDDQLTDRAAALTYYGILALFPALLSLVAVLGLVGQVPRTTEALFQILRDAGATQDTVDAVRGPFEEVVKQKGGAGALLGFGLAAALFSASGYVGAFTRAANVVYEIEEGRPFWKLRPQQLLITLVGVMLVALVLIALVVSGPLAEAVGDAFGLGSTAVTVWSIAKWPVMAATVMGIVASLYYLAPNVKQPRLRWLSPGGVLAVVLWAVATVGFFFYVSNFGSYNKTYGTLGGLIVLLVWLWLTNVALLFGLEFDSELERARELEAGLPAEDRIQLPPREEPNPPEPAREVSPDGVRTKGEAPSATPTGGSG